jgi:hypothetical protein
MRFPIFNWFKQSPGAIYIAPRFLMVDRLAGCDVLQGKR